MFICIWYLAHYEAKSKLEKKCRRGTEVESKPKSKIHWCLRGALRIPERLSLKGE